MSHLLFTDDTLIFCEVNLDHICHLCCLFLCLETVLGMKINLAKLELVLVGIVEDVGSLASILGCKVFSLPMKYLGLPWGHCLRQNLSGMVKLKRYNTVLQVGSHFICQRMVRLC